MSDDEHADFEAEICGYRQALLDVIYHVKDGMPFPSYLPGETQELINQLIRVLDVKRS